jgi:acyl CoA:acetate/3-ketoacid CoA transferase alpha subunit
MKKVYGSAAEALDGVLFDGMFIASGGFGLCGIPELLLAQKILRLRPTTRALTTLASAFCCKQSK